jgi:dCMP deaminase
MKMASQEAITKNQKAWNEILKDQPTLTPNGELIPPEITHTIYQVPPKERELAVGIADDGKMNRPTWHEYFMGICDLVSSRSTCMRRKVGAVLVKEKRILSTGYNGAPSGVPHCSEAGCLRAQLNVPSGEKHELCRGVHAEQNAIIQAAYHGARVKGAVLYSTHQPCSICAKMTINAGIKTVYYKDGYDDQLTLDMFDKAKVRLARLET